ncbi:MAG: prepilin peptidase [bacterium]|nr:prepilin peptidase [bacterium]
MGRTVVLQYLLDVYVVLLGLVVGSYLNVVIYRLPRRISTILPRSRCPRCRTAIRPWDNIPVVSFLILRGRCRHCRATISWRYPLIEALTGLAFIACFKHFDVAFDVVTAVALCAAMIVLAMIDLEHYLLPDAITLPGIVLGLALQPWLSWSTFKDAALGAALGAGFLYALTWVYYRWRKVHGLGLGDVKMLAMVGAFLGWQGVIATLFIGSLSGSVVGVGMMLRGRMHLQSKLPFGVFLALGAVLTLFFGRQLVDAYLSGTALVLGRWLDG